MEAPQSRYQDNVRKLCAISLARLPRLVDHATGLMVLRADGPGHVTAGVSFRYTAITALGLARAEAHGLTPTVDRARLLEALDATIAGVDDLGDLGLALWASARERPALAEKALRATLEFEGFRKARGGVMVHSTELAWLVLGLTEALAAGVGDPLEVRARLDAATRRLLDHRGDSGLIAFARPVRGRASLPKMRLQGELGFFDAQVYSILALLRRDELRKDPEAREAARAIAERLLAHQQPLGQWAWHYNVRTGDVVDVYPVYSVHQDGMAPMALLAAERALGIATTPAVARGVEWLFGHNELGELMAEEDSAVIRRSIRRRRPFGKIVYALKLASIARFAGVDLGLGRRFSLAGRLASPALLEVDDEFRPYHFGWCLYAFAELAGAKASADASAPPRAVGRATPIQPLEPARVMKPV